MTTRNPFLKINPKDNVAVALDNLSKGYQIQLDGASFKLEEAIPLKHKFACEAFTEQDSIYMYGVLVGEATKSIPQGGLLSTDNIKHKTQEVKGKTAAWEWTPLTIKSGKNGLLWDIIVLMVRWEQIIFGYFSLWYFVKIEILKPLKLFLKKNSILQKKNLYRNCSVSL
jgi:hypothetical protein